MGCIFFQYLNLIFFMLYGAKYQAISKLTRIYEIKNLIKNNKNLEMLKIELIYLAYSLTGHASRYKLDRGCAAARARRFIK